ncbi:putative OFR1ab [Aphis citricidus meson-like virus]|uniref:Replicase polyprotein 1ab n=1 Tax=Aphis citricidus meson-like virus TaxID=2788946 RepID=A0AAE7TNB0_9NIDO|nr:putative OFR1ab [Aphis citricidus meson-like virus]QPD01782.1 putative OFR1ab [Aphis citricidus meson-like virus]
MDTEGSIIQLVRYKITPITFADIYAIIKTGDWTLISKGLEYVTWFKFKYTYQHNPPRHSCCLQCRRYLSEMGLLLHTINQKLRATVKKLLRHYNFRVTADNVDLNGLIDFEDFTKIKRRTLGEIDNIIEDVMAPFSHMFYSYYEQTGCYFISSPIYPINTILTLDNYRTAVYNNSNDCIFRPSYESFVEFLNLKQYFNIQPKQDIYNFWANIKTREYPKGLNYHIHPIINERTYIDLSSFYNFDIESLTNSELYIKTTYKESLIQTNLDLLYSLSGNNTIYLYVYDHPDISNFHKRSLELVSNYWINHLYDANVNLSHFNDILNYSNTGFVKYPIIGSLPAKPLAKCDECSVDKDISEIYDHGTLDNALHFLDPETVNFKSVNPLTEYDQALMYIGDFYENSPFTHEPNLNPGLIINWNLLDYFKRHGLTIHIPPAQAEPLDDAETTYQSSYYFRPPTYNGVVDDLNLFNLNSAGSISPVNLLMCYEYVLHKLRSRVVATDGKPSIVLPTSTIKVRNPHKSSGIPYRNYGDAEFMRDLYGKERDKITLHKTHSADPSFTLVINKVAISTKPRDRTILAINSNKSECGRRLYRNLLEKIKYSAKRGGPILIGFSPMYNGWDNFFKQLDNAFNNNKYTLRGGKDYPKWDRKVSNLIQFVASSIFFMLQDPYSVNEHCNGESLHDLFNEFLAETSQIIYDFLIYDKSLYQKPGGVTSGNSRTADGNSFCHLIFEANATLMQLSKSTSENFDLYRDIRDEISYYMFNTPAHYLNCQPYFNNPKTIDYIETHISRILVLSDDAVCNFDSRVIDYDDLMAESLMISNYDMPMNKEKYHVVPIHEGAKDFLSQETFNYKGKFYPLPNFERVVGALVLDTSTNTYNPKIELARTFALYSCLYPYLKIEGHKKEKQFIKTLGRYIDEHPYNIDIDTVNQLNLFDYLEIDTSVDLKSNRDLFLDRLYGYDVADEEYNLTAESVKLSNCFLCGQQSMLVCLTCRLTYCNNLTNSHLITHMKLTKHYEYATVSGRRIRCNKCNESDINHLYHSTNDTITCLKHNIKPNPKSLICDDRLLLYSDNKSNCVGQLNYDLLYAFYKAYAVNNITETIKILITLSVNGTPYPYYRYVRDLTRIEYKKLKTEENIIYIQVKNFDSFNNKVTVTLPPNTRINQHHEYNLIYNLNDADGNYKYIPITPTSDFLIDGTKYYTIWYFNVPEGLIDIYKCKQIVSKPIDTLGDAIDRGRTDLPTIFTKFFSFENNQPNLIFNYQSTGNYYNMDLLVKLVRTNQFNIVQGPPGCGKTYLASHFVKLMINNSKRVLFYAPSHKAVNVMLNKCCALFPSTQHSKLFNRVISNDKNENVQRDIPNSVPIRQSATYLELVTFCTVQSFKACQHIQPDVVIIDEFSQLSDFYLFLLMQNLPSKTSIIYFGDQYQLSTVDDNRRNLPVDYKNLINYNACKYNRLKSDNNPYLLLKDHYRCHPDICDLVSTYTYNKTLNCKVDKSERETITNIVSTSAIHIYFSTLTDEERRSSVAGVYYNESEYKQTIQLINNNVVPHLRSTVAILCCYNSQCERFIVAQRNNLIPANIRICTIDSSQGDEFDYVYLCFTRVNNFTLDPCRLNVAISRARCDLYLTLPSEGYKLLPTNFHNPKYLLDVKLILNSEANLKDLHLNNLRDEQLFNKQPAKLLSPIYSDYFVLDVEFVNFYNSVAKNYSIPLQTSLRNNVVSQNLCGQPIIYHDNLKPFVLDMKDNLKFIDKYPKHMKQELILSRKALFRDVQKASSLGNQVDFLYIVRFIHKHTTCVPVLVTWSGDKDYPFFHPYTIYESLKCSVCKYPASFATKERQAFCTYHSKTINNIHYLVNPRLIDINLFCDQTGMCKFLIRNTLNIPKSSSDSFDIGNKQLYPERNNTYYNLTMAHSLICTENHGSAHDATVDTNMTYCLFQYLWYNEYNYFEQLFDNTMRFRDYDPTVTACRKNFLNSWFSNVSVGHFCELGGGKHPRPGYTHNVDQIRFVDNIQEDMNLHVCDIPLEVYTDAYYYRTKHTSKEALIFSDCNLDHYDIHTTKYKTNYIYKYSRTYKYSTNSGLFLDKAVINGPNLFYDFIPYTKCSGKHVFINEILDNLVIPCKIPALVGSTICTEHYKHYDKFKQIAILTKFGFRFTHFNKQTIKPEANPFTIVPTTFNPKIDKFIPGYENRGKISSRSKSTQKAIQILNNYIPLQNILNLGLNYPKNLDYVFFGAAGYTGITPMANVFKTIFKYNLNLVDPRFQHFKTCNDINLKYHANEIKTYNSSNMVYLIISDVYNSTDITWFNDLIYFTNYNLYEDGSLIFKITSCFDSWDLLNKLSQSFKIAKIERLPITGLSSELWVFMLGFTSKTPNGPNNNFKTLAYNIWYSMYLGVGLDSTAESLKYKSIVFSDYPLVLDR